MVRHLVVVAHAVARLVVQPEVDRSTAQPADAEFFLGKNGTTLKSCAVHFQALD
jgi:hypothetical protein